LLDWASSFSLSLSLSLSSSLRPSQVTQISG
jgi:hypothetical protein